ncbi:MAG: zinc ribbon domain-containing protein, partial [Deltaproteobacteria bacterium]|nr:zinc ribbon domain-containing protein [Deltaproteobacteria bacterium]
MKCPSCQHENPDEAKFCIECGNPIEFQCPKCGANTPRTSKFCMECGHNLTQPTE